jgi:hypothetical protein
MHAMRFKDRIEKIPVVGMPIVTVKSGGRVRITAWDVGGPGKIRCMWEHYLSVAKGWLAVILLSINLTFNGAYKINGNPDKTNCHAIFIFLCLFLYHKGNYMYMHAL